MSRIVEHSLGESLMPKEWKKVEEELVLILRDQMSRAV